MDEVRTSINRSRLSFFRLGLFEHSRVRIDNQGVETGQTRRMGQFIARQTLKQTHYIANLKSTDYSIGRLLFFLDLLSHVLQKHQRSHC